MVVQNPAYQLFILEALQLQRIFGLFNEFVPSGSVPDAVLPVVYSHVLHHFLHNPPTCFWVFLVILLTWVSIHILFDRSMV
jgi:hypothetical protein